eukprot:14400525-Ditylum_brightwellii.AAC.1
MEKRVDANGTLIDQQPAYNEIVKQKLTTMEPVCHTNGPKPDDEYEDQFIWDTDAQEPNESIDDNLDMETPDGAGENWKAPYPILLQTK